jgi:hypothetical protein
VPEGSCSRQASIEPEKILPRSWGTKQDQDRAKRVHHRSVECLFCCRPVTVATPSHGLVQHF